MQSPFKFQTPETQDDWKEIIIQFARRWNYPACIGAVDGKHVRLRCPLDGGSQFYNYKGYHSLVLMGVVNGNYEFVYINVGAEGKTADGGCWRQCDFARALEKERLNLPPNVQLDANTSIPVHLIGDDAFPMTKRLLKPYPQRMLTHDERIFNYRLSRARRLVENVFGIVSSKFHVLKTEMAFNVPHCVQVVKAVCILHNILRRLCGQSYMPPGSFDAEDINYEVIPGNWRDGEAMESLRPTTARNHLRIAKETRLKLTNYFVSEAGAVPWQNDITHTQMDQIIEDL